MKGCVPPVVTGIHIRPGLCQETDAFHWCAFFVWTPEFAHDEHRRSSLVIAGLQVRMMLKDFSNDFGIAGLRSIEQHTPIVCTLGNLHSSWFLDHRIAELSLRICAVRNQCSDGFKTSVARRDSKRTVLILLIIATCPGLDQGLESLRIGNSRSQQPRF